MLINPYLRGGPRAPEDALLAEDEYALRAEDGVFLEYDERVVNQAILTEADFWLCAEDGSPIQYDPA